jgi:hypothetical protein
MVLPVPSGGERSDPFYRNVTDKLRDLGYQYDAAGSRTGIGGSFARTVLPAPIAAASYDADVSPENDGSPNLDLLKGAALVLLATVSLSVAVALHGCSVLDIPPARGPLDEFWTQRMLMGSYGAWANGQEVPSRARHDGRIESYPDGAAFTRYGIEVRQKGSANAGWEFSGGLIGRADAGASAIELFGREVMRIHGPSYTLAVDRDISYDMFLVVRVGGSNHGRLVKSWQFAPEELALSPPVDPRILERSTRSRADIKSIVSPAEGALRLPYIDGYLDFDPQTKSSDGNRHWIEASISGAD